MLSYIEGDAFNWYSRFVIPFRFGLSWPQLRSMFDDRFVRHVAKSIVEASRRTNGSKETVQAYLSVIEVGLVRVIFVARPSEDLR